jgi:hypothetical protein
MSARIAERLDAKRTRRGCCADYGVALARVFLILISAVLLVGCPLPYPVYKEVQPSAQIKVLDESGEPIEGAKVVLLASSNPHPVERGRETKFTDQHGVAHFESRREWRKEAMMMHGVEYFFWNWCVQKPDFKTYLSQHGSSGNFDPHPTVRLSRGASSECPPPPSSQPTAEGFVRAIQN